MFNKVLNFNRNRDITNLSNGMPNMADTLNGWEIPLNIEKIIQAVVDGDAVTKSIPMDLVGVFQPLKSEDLQFKPEGQRSWSWYWLHAKSKTNENLQTQDKIIYKGKRYKVMAVKDYSLNGYLEYELIADFEGNN